jgi:hypothetical protein
MGSPSAARRTNLLDEPFVGEPADTNLFSIFPCGANAPPAGPGEAKARPQNRQV